MAFLKKLADFYGFETDQWEYVKNKPILKVALSNVYRPSRSELMMGSGCVARHQPRAPFPGSQLTH